MTRHWLQISPTQKRLRIRIMTRFPDIHERDVKDHDISPAECFVADASHPDFKLTLIPACLPLYPKILPHGLIREYFHCYL